MAVKILVKKLKIKIKSLYKYHEKCKFSPKTSLDDWYVFEKYLKIIKPRFCLNCIGKNEAKH
jgi:hypothetical protein